MSIVSINNYVCSITKIHTVNAFKRVKITQNKQVKIINHLLCFKQNDLPQGSSLYIMHLFLVISNAHIFICATLKPTPNVQVV